jgi:uncharacterized membrane protein
VWEGRVMDNHRTIGRDRRLRQTIRAMAEIAGVGGIALALYFAMPLDAELGALLAGSLVVVGSVALVPLSVRRARQVLVSDHPFLSAAQSLVSAITLLIVSFSSVYFVLATGHQGEIAGLRTKIDALYFTVTIVSTVGFGDITATGQTARGIVIGHMVVDVVLVAVAVRVVSWALKQRQDPDTLEVIKH